MKQHLLITTVLALTVSVLAESVVRERPDEWKNLVHGGPFKDLFLPIPVRDGLTDACWGGDNVKPRDITNGIEDPEWSYWCADPWKDENGVYHLFTARWPENHPRGHFGYFDSFIGHAVAEDPMGPYQYQDTIGPGHNPEIYLTAKGEYIIYSTHGRFYISDSLNGPWKAGTYNFTKRERWAFPNYVNFSFVPRDDGSYLAVSRRGYIWVSPDGKENWYEVSAAPIYPQVPGIFEDPVIWKDDVQYHIIVNDWKGRIAYYLRSKDGFHWVTEPGEAYVPGIARYEDGTVSDWYKYERIRFLQDDHGRPTHVFFAVIDSTKYDDHPNDIHNSKSIVIPMTVARLLSIENREPVSAATAEIRVRVTAEEGFNPHTDMDLKSLRFGSSSEVNYGRGAKVLATEKAGQDLILVFKGKQSGLTADNFAGKLLGKTRNGQLLFGWAGLPETERKVPLLSPLSPKFEFTEEGLEAYMEITNFGELPSEAADVKVMLGDDIIATGTVRPLKPFEQTLVRMVCGRKLPGGGRHEVTVVVEHDGQPDEIFSAKVRIPQQ